MAAKTKKSDRPLHTCGVTDCGRQFTKGGRPGHQVENPTEDEVCMCPMHYSRYRRGARGADLLAPMQARGVGARKPVMFRPCKEVAAKLVKALKRQRRGEGGPFEGKRDLSQGELIERACVEAFAVWFPGGL